MKTTIDEAGRLVVPKSLRDQLGFRAGAVEVIAEGTGIRIEPVPGDGLIDEGGRLVIPATGVNVSDELVNALRDADRR